MKWSERLLRYTLQKCKVLFYPTLLDFRHTFAFRKAPRLHPLVLLERATCRWRWVWSIGGMLLTGENCRTGEKPVPVPLCAPQISQGLTGIEPGPPRLALKVISLYSWSTTLWRRRGKLRFVAKHCYPQCGPGSVPRHSPVGSGQRMARLCSNPDNVLRYWVISVLALIRNG